MATARITSRVELDGVATALIAPPGYAQPPDSRVRPPFAYRLVGRLPSPDASRTGPVGGGHPHAAVHPRHHRLPPSRAGPPVAHGAPGGGDGLPGDHLDHDRDHPPGLGGRPPEAPRLLRHSAGSPLSGGARLLGRPTREREALPRHDP